ncbi:BTAD domain-containing putative transcriptional regulator [Williamsia sp.]|uniref:BTAD domain-containing putative transcriptional regulator n=1 Tax=Williamsia sp. TaxID=1872085 RepID=UPI002F930A99
MRYQVLGPLEVIRDENGSGIRVDLGSPKQRIILAILLIHRGKVVSTDRLCDALWGDDAPPSATSSLQAYISNLRRALRNDAGASPIRRQSTGYILDVADSDVDVSEFGVHAAEAQQHSDNEEWASALESADQALTLWRGQLLDGQGDEDWVRTEAAGLEEIRSGSLENRITALLALGRLSQALADVVALRNRQPYRDHSCWLHMLALHRAGRSAEALDVFSDHTHRLDTDLGLEPSTELRDLQGAVLRHDPELIAWPRKPTWSGAGELRAPDHAPSPIPADAKVPTPRGLVGRVRELDDIDKVLNDVLAGDTRWLIFIGPPGIGKTRLADEAAHLLHSAGGRAVWARNPEEGAPSWWPARQLVASLGSDPGEVFVTTGDVDADTARFTVYDRVQRIIEQESETSPLAVIVDDVQWADSMSVGALASMATAVHRQPIAFVITLREGEHNPAIGRLLSAVARGMGNRQIVVPELDEAEVGALANEIATEELTPDEVTGLAKRTGGNPLFVSEYARLPAGERSAGELPVAVRSVLGLRLAGLDPAVLQILRMAAVIGDPIDIVLLSRATGLDIDALADHLDAAADERIVTATPGSDSYVFAHGLLREEVLAQTPTLRRKRAHAKVAEILSDAEGSDALGKRAQHLMTALPLVDPELAVDACTAAAETSAAQWHSEVAAYWWQQALTAYALLPPAEQVDERRDELTVLLLEALSRAGKGQTVLQTVEAALTAAIAAEKPSTVGKLAGSLLRSGGGWPWVSPAEDPAPLLALLTRAEKAVADDPAERAQVLGALSVGHSYHPDPTIAPELILRAEGFAASTGDPDIIAEVMMARLITFSGVATHARETVALIDSLLALNHRQARFDAVIAHSIGTMATFTLGDVDAARTHLRLAIAGSEELNLPILRAQLRWMEVVVAVWIGDFERAQQHQAIAKRVHEQTELYVTGQSDMSLMSLSRELGRITEISADRAKETITGVAASTEDTNMLGVIAAGTAGIPGAPVDRALAAALIAQRQATCGAHVWHTLGHAVALAHVVADFELTEYAEEFIAELEPFADHIGLIGQLGNVGPVGLALSRLYVLTGNPTAASESVAVAAGIAERSGGRPTLLRCRVLDLQLRGAGDRSADEFDELERQAEELGMAGVRSELRRLRTSH